MGTPFPGPLFLPTSVPRPQRSPFPVGTLVPRRERCIHGNASSYSLAIFQPLPFVKSWLALHRRNALCTKGPSKTESKTHNASLLSLWNAMQMLLTAYIHHNDWLTVYIWAPARREQGGQAPTLEKNQGGHGMVWKLPGNSLSMKV